LKSVLTLNDKPARSRITCQGGKIIKRLYLIVTPIRVRGMAGLSLGEWFWKSVEAGINRSLTSITLRTASTCLYIRRNDSRPAGR
jgi:hypothetical protein